MSTQVSIVFDHPSALLLGENSLERWTAAAKWQLAQLPNSARFLLSAGVSKNGGATILAGATTLYICWSRNTLFTRFPGSNQRVRISG